jgi:hypothetical protein
MEGIPNQRWNSVSNNWNHKRSLQILNLIFSKMVKWIVKRKLLANSVFTPNFIRCALLIGSFIS